MLSEGRRPPTRPRISSPCSSTKLAIVREYTNTRHNQSPTGTRTKQFSVGDVGFWKDRNVLPRRSDLATLLTADEATMIISNQKNDIRGDQLHHEANGTEFCPVKALAHQIHHILSHGGTEESVLSTYFDDDGEIAFLRGDDIVKGVRLAVIALDLPKAGIKAEQVGSHSLRAGGAMAMKLNGSVRDTIPRKFGRWNSDTFLMYIHNQIAHLSAGLASVIDVIFFCATFKIPFRRVSAGLVTNLNTDSSLGSGTRPALHCAGPSGPTCRGSASASGVASKHAREKGVGTLEIAPERDNKTTILEFDGASTKAAEGRGEDGTTTGIVDGPTRQGSLPVQSGAMNVMNPLELSPTRLQLLENDRVLEQF
eukprot:scaffold90284_cov45-Attheya_sp.AAC.2